MEKFKPLKILFDCGRSVDWLYPKMMMVLKERYGSSAIYVCSPDRLSEFKSHCHNDDKVVSIASFDPLYVGFDSTKLNYNEEYNIFNYVIRF